jgi:predicted ribosome quality control (RQC) complex YloA/Tae2 family protein
MVYYFTSTTVDPPAFIYVGKDKVENEDLIKFGWDEDVWFHVDNLSSAHVYLRMKAGDDWASIPQPLLEDCAQLTKANSIDGQSSSSKTFREIADIV